MRCLAVIGVCLLFGFTGNAQPADFCDRVYKLTSQADLGQRFKEVKGDLIKIETQQGLWEANTIDSTLYYQTKLNIYDKASCYIVCSSTLIGPLWDYRGEITQFDVEGLATGYCEIWQDEIKKCLVGKENWKLDGVEEDKYDWDEVVYRWSMSKPGDVVGFKRTSISMEVLKGKDNIYRVFVRIS